LADSYAERFAAGEEPENMDKECLRLWFVEHGDPYRDAVLPPAPQALILTLASRYIQLYERITGQTCIMMEQPIAMEQRMMHHVAQWLASR
jgi:phosphoribosylaminoimidazole-succinocarboxamide synthase